ncbi:FunK1 protein kinase [Xylaria digitata]|nr:FunK1 protein kinase [Xylaria digitata]
MEENPLLIHQASPATASAMDDQEIFDNINDRMHGPMNGFIKKYFGDFRYISEDASLEIQAAGKVHGHYGVPKAPPSLDNFVQWLCNYTSHECDPARGSWHVLSDNIAPEDEVNKSSARLLLTMSASSALNKGTARWDNVQAIGQFHHGSVCYQNGLLHLCRSAHNVFASQPTRLFLHGFYVRGSLVELWVFDRSGLYCSDIIDIQKEFAQFLFVILRYQQMTDSELGNIDIIKTDESGSYIVLDNAVTPPLGKLYLEHEPIAAREGLVGTGTTCYRARAPNTNQWSHVLKFKWRWARQRSEDELLVQAKEKRVWGAVSLDYYHEVESTANLRRGLRWGTHRKLAKADFCEKQESIKESCIADGLVDHTEETDDFFQNRILTCIVTSPVGRPLHTFQSLKELLQVFRDSIKCHRSLYFDARILHQDVSPGNMIILDDQDENKPKGILIDLDSAIELADGLETDLGITGTRPFMAIGVLKSECHTYRHDLESFFYAFLWTIITNHTDNPPGTSKLRRWSNGDWSELAARKTLDMNHENFQSILEEFTTEFDSLKPLAQNLRQILFPMRDGVLWIGTESSYEAVNELYDRLIGAFEESIDFEARRQIDSK